MMPGVLAAACLAGKTSPWFFGFSVLDACGRTIRTDLWLVPGEALSANAIALGTPPSQLSWNRASFPRLPCGTGWLRHGRVDQMTAEDADLSFELSRRKLLAAAGIGTGALAAATFSVSGDAQAAAALPVPSPVPT